MKIKTAFWTILAFAIGATLAWAATFSLEHIGNSLKLSRLQNSAFVEESISGGGLEITRDSPKYFYLNKDFGGEPKVQAKAYLVGDLDTGEVILAKNQDEKLPTASISKLMTSLVLSELAATPNFEPVAKISSRAVDTKGKNGGLRIGEKIKISDLFYPLLLESSNDAAEAIAEHFGREVFIKKMNQQAEKLAMLGTYYEDPSGLSPNNLSTAADVFKLAGYLRQRQKTEGDTEAPDLLKITTLRSYSNKKHNWSNISQFVGQASYLGGKSGYTDLAKETTVSLFDLPLGKDGSRPIAITVLGSPDREKDIGNILKYLKKNVYYGGASDATADWIREKVGVPDIREPDFVTLAFLGDIMLDRGVKSSVLKNFGGDYSALFEKVGALKNSDIVFANLEGTASDRGRDGGSLYSFRMDPGTIPALAGAGVDILSVANNHVGDWGRSAYTDTLSRLEENEILYTGGGNNKREAETPAIIEKYGMKIGFLGFSDVGPNWMKATDSEAGLLLASNPRFDEIIQNAAKQADYLIVSFHFGDEYKPKHNARQETLAHRAVDNGAKIVIGHHPHVIEDTEVYKQNFIAYSLGNFIFDQSWSQPTMQGLLLQIKLHKDGSIEVKKNTVKLNSAFQPERIISGKEEKIKF